MALAVATAQRRTAGRGGSEWGMEGGCEFVSVVLSPDSILLGALVGVHRAPAWITDRPVLGGGGQLDAPSNAPNRHSTDSNSRGECSNSQRPSPDVRGQSPFFSLDRSDGCGMSGSPSLGTKAIDRIVSGVFRVMDNS